MDLSPDLDFLAWYFTFFDGKVKCPECNKIFEKE